MHIEYQLMPRINQDKKAVRLEFSGFVEFGRNDVLCLVFAITLVASA